MVIFLNILPVFFIIGLGLVGARRGFFPPAFLGPANQLTYWLAIPALVFKAVATAPLQEAFQPLLAIITIITILLIWFFALLFSRFFYKGINFSRASWIQCSMHSTQASMGLAVVFFALGQQGLNTAGMVAAVISITQNLLAVLTLSKLGNSLNKNFSLWHTVFLHPIIIASTTGLLFSLTSLSIPEFITRILNILGGMGLPLALLIIGAKLNEGKLGGNLLALVITIFLKLIALPGLALLLMFPWHSFFIDIPMASTILLLASPTAIVAVIMASQMGGDPRLASEIVTATYAASAITYGLWLWLINWLK